MSKRYRDAGESDFVSADYAEANPMTTVSETVNPDYLRLNHHKRQHLETFKKRLEYLQKKVSDSDKPLNYAKKEISALKWILGIFT